MTFKVGQVVLTHSGKEVEILKVDAPGDESIVGIFIDNGYVDKWCSDGSWMKDCEDVLNLIPFKFQTDEWNVFLSSKVDPMATDNNIAEVRVNIKRFSDGSLVTVAESLR